MNNTASNDGSIVFLEAEEVLNRLRVLQELITSEIQLYYADENSIGNIEIKGFMHRTVGVMKLHTVFTTHQLDLLVKTVFSSAQLRDFVMCITDKFQILYGDQQIVNTIARAVSNTATTSSEYSLSLIPDHIAQNMQVNETVIRSTLQQNKWLCTILLMHLAMTILADNKQTPEKVKSK
jgi:hypothetical protein